MATCSTDRSVKIWQKNPQGKWDQISSVTNQEGPIQKVVWAHPEFGNILAACSMDRSINLYEQNKNIRQTSKEQNDSSTQVQWQITRIYGDKEAIEDMKFSPKHQGLILAVARADGKIRIFAFPDLLNLQIHQNYSDIQVSSLGINCLSWNKNRFERPMIAVGCKDKDSSQTKNLQGIISNNQRMIEEETRSGQCFKIFAFNNLASLNSQDHFQMKLESSEPNGLSLMHTQAVNDVSWSLLNGRSFHLIGTCGKEGARVWQVKSTSPNDNYMQVMKVVDLFDTVMKESIEVWKISWNVMASLVATSDNNNEIKIFKAVGVGKWEKIKSIKEVQDSERQIN